MDTIEPERSVAKLPSGADSQAADVRLLNEIGRIATLDLELRPMLQRITDVLARQFQWEFVALVTIDHEHDRFRCEAVTSSVPTAIHADYVRSLGSGIVGQVAATAEPIVLDDVRTHPNYVETMPGALSEMCIPIRHRGRTVAVINLESVRLGAFRGQLPLLETVADQIAGAIANAQQYRELQSQARLMEMMSEVSRTALEATHLDELLHRIVRYISERFPLTGVSIDLSAETRYPPRANVALVPIRFQNALLGTLVLEASPSSPDATSQTPLAPDEVFTRANMLAFHAFADQMAGAIRLAKVNGELAETSRLLALKTTALEEANAHLAKAIETLHHISTQDGLTGIANRRHFDEVLGLEWRRGTRSGTSLAVLLLDIDHFKSFNDTSGHQAGDDCLRMVANTLRSTLQRATDVVARYGGEEFVLLFPQTELAQARALANTLRERIESEGLVTVSIGVAACVPERDVDPAVLVKRADEALYAAKAAGRNCVR